MIQNILKIRDEYIETYKLADSFFKIGVYLDSLRDHKNEIECLKVLHESEIAPEFFRSEILEIFELVDSPEDNCLGCCVHYITLIEMSRFHGKSLLETYIPLNKHIKYGGPGTYVSDKHFDVNDIRSQLPRKYISEKIFNDVINLLLLLINKYGIYHDDIHAGNFMEVNGKIVVVDFDCSTIKTKMQE